jgi:hypothetical protein
VEIKSSVADFRADQKWIDYRLHCDRLFFRHSARCAARNFSGRRWADRSGCLRRLDHQ